MRDKHRYKLSKLPRKSSFARVRNRCIFTGRPRSVYEFFRISRIVFRHLEGAAKPNSIKAKGGLTFPDAESSYSNLAMLMEKFSDDMDPHPQEMSENPQLLRGRTLFHLAPFRILSPTHPCPLSPKRKEESSKRTET
ncbi:hypothetical protein Q3G72_018435 [Acer saccharum]|nr:hypothetical protein Q3G72_018435 [Acer saccharum]